MENIHENCSTLIIQHGREELEKEIEKLRKKYIFEYKRKKVNKFLARLLSVLDYF